MQRGSQISAREMITFDGEKRLRGARLYMLVTASISGPKKGIWTPTRTPSAECLGHRACALALLVSPPYRENWQTVTLIYNYALGQRIVKGRPERAR